MTRRRYPILRVTIVALFAHCLAHAWRTGHGGIQLRLDTQNGSIRASVLKIPRGGGELPPSDGDEIDESSSAEHDTETAEKGEEIDRLEREENKEMENASDKTTTLQTSSPPPTTSSPQRKVRHTSDVIVNLIGKNNVLKQESIDLRQLITSRAQSYIDDLSLASTNDEKLPKPKRVLHFVAPKIPAIKNSPDVMLRVQSFKGGTDTGVAACAIGTVARLCELYDRQKLQDIADEEEFVSIGEEIVRDRRFQQLVELVLCGVDIKKRKKEAEKMNGSNVAEKSVEARDIEDVLDEEDAVIDDGLSVQDACRAAWGIALLAGFHTESFSDVATEDILTALSLRSRELLLARLQLLREGETMKECNDGHLSLVERLNQDAEELAEDAASAMWAFACVKACTGVRSVALFETCCTILCQSPDDLRERAAKEKDGLDGSSFEVNDVVDKLQRAESDEIVDESIDSGNSTSAHETNENDGDESDSMDELSSKDALLDWLTPNEVTDVLWALALQGSTVDTDLKEEIALSETASAFREIAFDRLVMWLRRDLGIIEDVKKDSGSNSSSISADGIEEEIIELENPTVSLETTGTGEGETIIEVVDAASLLASTATMETEVVNANAVDRVEDSREGVGEGQIQVVDAATLLACSPEGQMDADTELLVASTLARSYEPLEEEIEEKPEDRSTTTTESIACYDRQIVSERLDIKSDMTTLLLSRRLSFSPHDLCSIAWAVTDLRDPLRYLIVDLITQMFASLGKESFEVLSMADLSNLAWAVARSTSEKRSLTFAEYSETPAANVTRWTAETALSRLGIYGQRLGDHDVSMMVRSMLQEFQPPELGRLLWSLTCTVANYIDPLVHKKQRDVALSQLATTALLTAGTNLSIFSTEDLTRIAWAFLELCDVSTALSQPLVGEALGSILATIESSLLLWESAPHSKSAQDTKRSEDTLHFSTFFGKSRLPWRLLNQMIHEHEDDEESQKSSRKTSLPLLRDLPVDPSSLCKLSSAYSRLAQEQRDVMGGWTFVRVAVRLLSSKNGQLMEQCPLIDVIGLCHACAISEVNGRERGQVLRLFAGRVVQFMNDALDPDAATHGRAAARLERATPWEIAALVWSIGELGARHFPADENRQQAHRKLRLISDRPLLTEDELNTLSVASTANLLHGISLMGMVSSDPVFVSSVATSLASKVQSLEMGKELVDVALTTAKLRRSTKRYVQQSSDNAPSESIGDNGNKATKPQADQEEQIDPGIDKTAAELDASLARSDILDSTTQILTSLSTLAIEHVCSLSAGEMSDLLLVYSTLPFRSDDLVNAIEEETNRRLEILGFPGPEDSIQNLARRAFESSSLASNTLTTESKIKKGIKAIFGAHDISDEETEEHVALLAALAENTQRTTTLIQETLARMEQIKRGTGADTEALLRGVEQGTAIELGRCKELVSMYRRINFSTDSIESRYDSTRRRNISKRILSRLFP